MSNAVYKYGPTEPRVIMYGPTEPRWPTKRLPIPNIGEIIPHSRKKELEKILNDYLDFLAEVEETALLENIDALSIAEFISELKTNLRLLKTRLDDVKKRRKADAIILYAVITPRKKRKIKKNKERENVDMYAPVEPRDNK